MGLFNKSNSLLDEIRCDEQNCLIWKWHPAGTQSGAHRKENAIRWGSSLRVKEGQVAVFVSNQDSGIVQEYIEGPFDQMLDTYNLPVISNVIGLAYGGGTPFQAEVYFINMTRGLQIRFGVPYFDVCDTRFPDFGVPVAVRGTLTFQISDYREFIKIHGMETISLDSFQKKVRDYISKTVKSIVINAVDEYRIPVVQLERKILEITELIQTKVKSRLKNEFGIVVSCVDVSAIELNKESAGYQQLKKITQDIVTAQVQTRCEAEMEDYSERMRISREEQQYAQRKQIESTYFAAYQIEKQTEASIAAAKAFGETASSGTGNQSTEGGFNPVGVVSGMIMGSTIGQNLSGALSEAMGGITPANAVSPPPVCLHKCYYIAEDGQAIGPYDMSEIEQLIHKEKITDTSLIWESGMTDWMQVCLIPELRIIFEKIRQNNLTPPPIPKVETLE